ncbi:phenylacetate--CoA ligase family protein [Filobacillus milosensis]|uniref:Phenylacetate--CoA ligase family protein n=1 Tax=Filobacillus milosensis TaxID=94137 RepID=A0A4Y8IK93_9BACI|nr:AMP-binding protein [Filobacillus milosensis]TFB21364.1 phenylacetate--CoA ligase family protein [Filobacillus milosensis]
MNSLFEKKLRSISKPEPLVKYFSSDTEFPDIMPIQKIEEFQKESLIEITNRAYKHCDFYQKKMDQLGVKPENIKELKDLSKLPLTSKEELRGNPYALLACDKEDISLVQVSTGTTGGEEIYMMYTWEDYYLHELSPGYPKLFPIESDDICINSLPYEMSASGLAFHKTFLEGCGATVVATGKGGAYSTSEKTVRMMRDLKPTVIITTPSWAIQLAEAAEEMSFDLKSLPLKTIWLTGEGCSPSFRDRVEEIWGTQANFYYGSLECGGLGVECEAHNGYHIPMGHAIIEIIDPETGEVLEPGEVGEIVVTSTVKYDSPLIRFRTKDLGFIERDVCSCGCALPRLQLRGRLVDHIDFQGESHSPIYLEEMLMRLPEVGYWFEFVVNPNRDYIKIRCELQNNVTPSEDLAESLSSKLEFDLGIPFKFEFVDQMPRSKGKTVRVVHEEDKP